MSTLDKSKDKHPLYNKWCFYYAPRGRRAHQTGHYEDNIIHLGDFSTIEDFYSFYCFMKRPSEIEDDHKILMFRKGCSPLWEEWINGGCWILQLKKKDLAYLDNKWENLLISCITEEINDINLIGVCLSIRAKRNIIEIWLRDCRDENQRRIIGENIQRALDLDPAHLIFAFKENSKALVEQSILRNSERYEFVKTPFETPLVTPAQIKDETGTEKMDVLKL